MPERRELMLEAADGTSLFVTDSWLDQPAATRRGIVLMHGLGEHSGRYAHVVRFFNDCGWSVRSFDHRGHGRSGGKPGDVPDSEAMLRDAKIVIDDFAQPLADAPLLFGHSMGGLFAACFAIGALSPLRGLILSSPALKLLLSIPQKLLLKTLGVLAPGFAVSNGLSTGYLSHDQSVIDAYNKDPLVHPVISARLLNGMLDAIRFSQAHANELAIPTLIAMAGDDHLVNPVGSTAFFDKLRPEIGTLHLYQHFYHEIFNELEVGLVYGDVRAWLAKYYGHV